MADPGREILSFGTGIWEPLGVRGRGIIEIRGVCERAGVPDVLGVVGAEASEGESARCISDVGGMSSSFQSERRLEDLPDRAGAGIWLGV